MSSVTVLSYPSAIVKIRGVSNFHKAIGYNFEIYAILDSRALMEPFMSLI